MRTLGVCLNIVTLCHLSYSSCIRHNRIGGKAARYSTVALFGKPSSALAMPPPEKEEVLLPSSSVFRAW
jgi:hypothetical protein